MVKRMLIIILSSLVLYLLLQLIKPILPDWMRIILNANPKYLGEAVSMAKDTYKYDKEK